MTDINALIIAVVCLYSTRHWIGATALLVWLAWVVFSELDDPLGAKAMFRAIRSYRG
jgi:hypothetical protein